MAVSVEDRVAVAQKYLRPYQGGPWLYNTFPRVVGHRLLWGGLGSFLLGGIGAGHGMVAAVALFFLLSGCVVAMAGGFLLAASTQVPAEQFCPKCLSNMRLGAIWCPACRHEPRLP